MFAFKHAANLYFLATESILDPTCWTIITEERNTCCLIAREHELFKLRQGDSVCSIQSVAFEKEFKSIIAVSVSYNQKYLALYTNNGIIWMGSADMKSKYCEFETNRSERPRQIEWFVIFVVDGLRCHSKSGVISLVPLGFWIRKIVAIHRPWSFRIRPYSS